MKKSVKIAIGAVVVVAAGAAAVSGLKPKNTENEKCKINVNQKTF